jgi:STE24 endopeptidase
MSRWGDVSDLRARRYHRAQFWLGAAAFALGVSWLLAFLLADVAHGVLAAGGRLSTALAWRVACVAVALGTGERVLTFPLAWIRGWWLPRRYGLLHQPLAAWFRDRAKAAALAGAFGLVTVEVIYLLMAATPLWWLAAAGVLVGLQMVIAFVFPVWLLPLFYRLVPLADDELRRRVLALASRAGVDVVGVWVADQSRKSRTANAALAGLGRTRRIVLFDTLVGQFPPDEIEAVLAHELGHHVHHDVWRGLGVQAALTVLALGIADRLLALGVELWGLTGPADPAGLPWVALVLLGVGLVTTPLAHAFSRRVERQADDFALRLAGRVDAFVGAMERLATLNLAERRPHRLKELLFYSHPSIDRRIARAARLVTASEGRRTPASAPPS